MEGVHLSWPFLICGKTSSNFTSNLNENTIAVLSLYLDEVVSGWNIGLDSVLVRLSDCELLDYLNPQSFLLLL